MRKSNKYNIDLLQNIIERDNCNINLKDYEIVNIRSTINFICNCGNKHFKKFVTIYDIGAFCTKCTQKNKEKKIKATCLEKYGVEYALQSKELYKKKKETCLKKFGKEHASQLEEFKEKNKKICLEKYGVEHNSQTEKAKEQMRITCLEKYGVEYVAQLDSIKKLKKETSLKNYGVENPSSLEEVKNKMKETCLKKYGVEYVSHVPEISEKHMKNRFQYKRFKFLDGTVLITQGYENYALDELCKQGFKSSDIITSRALVPSIFYEDSKGKKHRYFVDIYIPKINKMIEVKSTWIYNRFNNNIFEKANECIKQGFDYEIWIYNGNKNKEVKRFDDKIN